MSTRGVIARQKGDSFEGRYHHWDSYPTGLGKALWELAHNQFRDNLDDRANAGEARDRKAPSGTS